MGGRAGFDLLAVDARGEEGGMKARISVPCGRMESCRLTMKRMGESGVMQTAEVEFPKLRALDFRPVEQDGRQVILLRDPLQLSEMLVAAPRQLGPVLALCDGTRDLSKVRLDCIAHFRLLVGMEVLKRLIEVCDEACLLENGRFRDACEQRLARVPRRALPHASPGRGSPTRPIPTSCAAC